ncbi:prolyl oligopeptidase family serine peptidase [Croceicoccus naphthovorans]|uniref:Prolyl oligopeptidase n=1 Tax=Croceicoccus naphthovorans TaxID=1348774 RepID=A0A0G3XJX2_9SPHN|nr:prolyl oligopeptidase family serine peptidase [Croceicoccus naphthovorans]AKM11865.1 prolyl oligopeptidase [Croceicoccus naphthovorans]MBB3989067.1 prolyl oligopeptidase [Croceicoccus naphthovorans]
MSTLNATQDPYVWLEETTSDRALAWVEETNAPTLATLKGDPRYQTLYDEAFAIASSQDRIAWPSFRKGELYNFWTDAQNLRGLWRKTTLDSYRSGKPEWTTILDIDALGNAEGKSWVYKGVNCLEPEERLCMLSLSDGGKDAVTVREFDIATRSFVDGGFMIPEGKNQISWEDADSLLVGTDFAGDGSDLTESGYPMVVKRLKRGQAMADATEVFRGEKSDVAAAGSVMRDHEGHTLTVFSRAIDFFHTTYHVETPRGLLPLALPQQSEVRGLMANRLIMKLSEDWTANGTAFPSGSVLSIDREALLADPANLKPTLVWQPGPSQAYEAMASTRDRLLISGLDNVRGKIWAFAPKADGGWTQQAIDLPDNQTLSLISADEDSNRFFISAAGFLNPNQLILADAETGKSEVLRTMPAMFDSTGLVVEQKFATSSDGTKIPYFLVHREDVPMNGTTPTILYGYGGFEVSMTPSYSAQAGKLWLENGGAWVLANIRGGGEFGPAWHQSVLGTKRQLAFDDFAAVGEDLIASGLTSPKHLGIMGGSNGGLLTGVEMTQRPDLWNAVSIQVPLLDMIRLSKIGAGASWQGEYGFVNEDPDAMAFWLERSPYHALKPGVDYPVPFITTSTADDRTHPSHARKFAARMAELNLPFYYFENTEGGHAAGADPKQDAQYWALQYTYMLRQLKGAAEGE